MLRLSSRLSRVVSRVVSRVALRVLSQSSAWAAHTVTVRKRRTALILKVGKCWVGGCGLPGELENILSVQQQWQQQHTVTAAAVTAAAATAAEGKF